MSSTNLDTKPKPNAKQQECIDSIDGSIMVLAGPGTGKTFTVIERIKNMLLRGIEPSKILCLAFSDAAASEMKKRLIDKMGQEALGVNIYTYHSFCFEIIQNNPDSFEEYSGFQLINDTVKKSLIRQCIEELDTVYYKTSSGDKYHFAGEILTRIDDIKKNLLSKDEFFYNLENHPQWGGALSEVKLKVKTALDEGKKVLKKDEKLIADLEKKINRSKELWNFYELYNKKMKEGGYIDFNDMIALVLEKFSDSPAFLESIAQNYDYYLVDEYQDTNAMQNSVIFNLIDVKSQKNIFVVGDDDQIIFGFQGAQTDNIERFLKKYPDTKVICLEENMRSTQSILDLSEQVAKQDSNRLENNPEFKSYGINKHLVAKNASLFDKNTKPILRVYEDLSHEYSSIADDIEKLIKNDGVEPNDIAILAKKNNELEEFYELLKARNIPCELKDGKSIFSVRSSILTYFYLKMLLNSQLYADKIFPLLLSEPFCIDINDYNDILANSYLHKNRDFIADIYDMKDKDWKNPDRINKFISDYEYLLEAKSSLNLYRLVLDVINKTGILEYFLNSPADVEENISALKKIADEAREFYAANKSATLQNFVEYLDDAFENGSAILCAKSPVKQNAVKLITLHSSKGREFEYVFIPSLEQYGWERAKDDTITPKIPLSKVITDEQKEILKDSEKIRLLFVGITRAKHKLFLSVPKFVGDKERRLTKYLEFIDEKYLETQEISYNSKNYVSELVRSIKYEHDYKSDFQNFIRSSFESLSISPSMLNTYLSCPRQFLYGYILRLNSRNSVNDLLSYGNVVHKSIENFSKKSKIQESYLTLDELIEDFKLQMSKNPFSDRTARKAYLEKGEENLRVFYNQLILTPISNIFSTELNIESSLNSEIRINGKIDRLEKNEQGDFIIKDFKTGAAKTPSSIKEGGAYEHYLNQLRFYKYLVEKKFDKKVASSQLVYVEDCDKNFTYNMDESDNVAIENKIKEVHANIAAQNFEPKPDKNNCKRCDYRDMCSLNLL